MLQPFPYLQKPRGTHTSQFALSVMHNKREQLFYSPKSDKNSILLEMVNTLLEKETIMGNELEETT